jgi:uncharacterized 2Fe-2S/4Fe-4S cluster protein (DUF4445 family)
MTPEKNEEKEQATVTVSGIGSFTVRTGLNLREALRSEGFYLDGTCADQGTCGRCVVLIVRGYFPPASQREAGILGPGSVDSGKRLACQVTVTGDMEIIVSKERILEIEKTGRWKTVWDSPLWAFNTFPLTGSGFGIALDLGTTSIAAALFDLDSGRLLDIRSAANPQIPWGDEIVSRLAAAREPETANTLQNLLWQEVGEIVRALCLRSGVSPGRITRVVAVGNSAIHHLSLGLPVDSLLTPPYSPVDTTGRVMAAGESPMGLKIREDALIYFPPLAGGYAGSDAIVSLMASVSQGIQTGAVIDVGTNTEIAVWGNNKRLVATAPSGPAFEGGHIRSGMQAEEGAIWKVEIGERDIRVDVIGGGKPQGICGTGIVDVVAGMLKNKIIDTTGLVQKGSHGQLADAGFYLDQAAGVVVEPRDIATVQKAKGAIAATIQVLMGRLDMEVDMLQRVYLAGAFGSRLNTESAMTIGLFPHLASDSYVSAGNTALVGASLVLLSNEAQDEVELLGKTVNHISVAEDDRFEELFLENLYFPQTQ